MCSSKLGTRWDELIAQATTSECNSGLVLMNQLKIYVFRLKQDKKE